MERSVISMAQNNNTEEKPRPKQKAPMPKGVQFEKGNRAAFKFKEEYVDRMDEYVDDGFMTVPTLEEFCEINKLPMRTVTRWLSEAKEDEEKYPRLANSYARLQNKQKMLLIQMGLCDKFNVQLVKFLLTNNHGMSDKMSAQVDAKTDNKFEVNIKVVD
jgi:hypothetical protein